MDPLYHIFFANDVLLLMKASNSHEGIISYILNRFAMFSGLTVNVVNSKVFLKKTGIFQGTQP